MPIESLLKAKNESLMLLIVSYKTSRTDVDRLKQSLAGLSSSVSYSVIANGHCDGDPIEELALESVYFITLASNVGYGRAVNLLYEHIKNPPKYVAAMNADIAWSDGAFESIVDWLDQNDDVCLAVPKIVDSQGNPQKLCKHDPTLLALLSRRFIPCTLKPSWLKAYDKWYIMSDSNYDAVFDVPYLSGCCMVIRSATFTSIGGFDPRYFLYLEDADITRTLRRCGRCVHLPIATIVHQWGRGSYLSASLAFINILSAIKYFVKWGIALW